MSNLIDFVDDGRMVIRVSGAEAEVDVMESSERFSRAVREANGDELVYAQKIAEVVQGFGIPPLSHFGNHMIAESIWAKCAELKKKFVSTQSQESVPA